MISGWEPIIIACRGLLPGKNSIFWEIESSSAWLIPGIEENEDS